MASERQLTLHRGTMSVVDDGALQGPTLVYIHGWMATASVFDPLFRAMATRGLLRDARHVTLDWNKTGLQSLNDVVDDVVATFDSVGVDGAIVVGHSMGGQIAQLLAATAPSRLKGLLLFTPVPLGGLALPPSTLASFAAAGGQRGALEAILRAASLSLSPADLQTLTRAALGLPAEHVAHTLKLWSAGVVDADAKLRQITAPTLVVGSDDPFIPTTLLQQSLVDGIAGARLLTMPDTGHYAHVEDADVAADIVAAFVDSVVNGGA